MKPGMGKNGRLEKIGNLLTQIAAGDLQAHESTAGLDDDLDAIITGLNMLAEELQRTMVSKEYAQGIIQSMVSSLIVINPDGSIRSVNQATLDLLGYEEKELIGQPAGKIIAAAAKSMPFSGMGLEQLIAQGSIQELDLIYKTKAGEEIPVSFSGSVLRDKAGMLVGVIGVAKDMRERRMAEEKLRTTLTDLETQKKALDRFAIVAETDADGTITYANDQFCKISKYRREELLGKNHRDVVNSGYHSREFWHDMWTTIVGGKVWRGDIRNRAKDGTIYWVDTTIVPFMGPLGEPEKYLAVRVVITERKEAEAEIVAKTTRLERFQAVTLERAMDMVKLKEEVNELLVKMGQPKKYEAPDKIKERGEDREKRSSDLIILKKS